MISEVILEGIHWFWEPYLLWSQAWGFKGGGQQFLLFTLKPDPSIPWRWLAESQNQRHGAGGKRSGMGWCDADF